MKPTTARALTDGLLAGLAGYAATAVFLGAADLVAGRSPFHTPGLIGSWLFYGTRDFGGAISEPGPALAYNGLHLTVFIGLGMSTAAAAVVAERRPPVAYPLFALALGFAILGTAMLVAVATPLAPGGLAWSSVVGAGIAGAAAVLGYLAVARPALRRAVAYIGAEAVPKRAAETVSGSWRPNIREMVDIHLWAVARPEARLSRPDPRRPPVPVRSLHCSKLDADVRLAWSPAWVREGYVEAEAAELVCLDHGQRCTGSPCPLFGLPPAELGDRLVRSGFQAQA